MIAIRCQHPNFDVQTLRRRFLFMWNAALKVDKLNNLSMLNFFTKLQFERILQGSSLTKLLEPPFQLKKELLGSRNHEFADFGLRKISSFFRLKSSSHCQMRAPLIKRKPYAFLCGSSAGSATALRHALWVSVLS